MKLTSNVFNVLYQNIVKKAEEKVELLDHVTYLPSGRGPAFFGFKNYSNAENSLKGIMLSDENVIDYIKITIQRTNNRSKIKKADIRQKLNGKTLYNKYLESKKDKSFVELNDFYLHICAIFLGYSSFQGFLNQHNFGDQSVLEIQRAIVEAETDKEGLSKLAIPFLGSYFSYHDNKIKRFVLEVDYLNNMRCRQSGFHLLTDPEQIKNHENVKLGQDKIFVGNAIDQGESLYLSLKSKSDEKGNNNYMSIFLNLGGMNIQDMTLIKGVITTKSVYGYLFSGEIFLRRVPKEIAKKNLLLNGYQEDDLLSLSIRRYLIQQRRTFRIPEKTPQKAGTQMVKGHRLDILSKMIGNWLIWAVGPRGNQEDESRKRIVIWQSCLVIQSDYRAILKTYGFEKHEEQVCIFRIAKGQNAYHLWINAHAENGIELKNAAVINIPEEINTKEANITTGCSIGLGVKSNNYALTPVVLMKVDSSDFSFRQLENQEVYTAIMNNQHAQPYLNKTEPKTSDPLPDYPSTFVDYTAFYNTLRKMYNSVLKKPLPEISNLIGDHSYPKSKE